MKSDNKILIVDDIEANLLILRNILNKEGFKIYEAENGKQAIDVAKKKLPDIILLDVLMPEMNGFEACKLLKEDDKTASIPVIFLTAYNEVENKVEGFKLGAVDYITKPFNKEELLVRIQTHLDLKHSKEEIHQRNEQLAELNATKDKFFSIIAHDLKNSFNAILGFTKLALDDVKAKKFDEIEEYCSFIRKASMQVYSLFNNLLQWARLQTGAIKFEPIPINLREVIENNIHLLEANRKKKEIKISVSVKEDMIIKADPFMLETVIRNLVQNAIKYTHNGGYVKISSKLKNNNIEIVVEDNGIGISKEDMEQLFKVESNFSAPGTDNEEGTGLGLILCREFIHKHGGEIWVESKENKGSKFHFTILDKS